MGNNFAKRELREGKKKEEKRRKEKKKRTRLGIEAAN